MSDVVAVPVSPAPAPFFEEVACSLCGSHARDPFISAEDDLTGKPGRFTFVTCRDCGLRYQCPRVSFAHIGAFYDDEYLAHRKKTDWGWLTPFYEHAMGKHDRDKEKLVRRFVDLDSKSTVLDVGCAVGTFLQLLRKTSGCSAVGVDFKDLSKVPTLKGVEFHHSTFPEADVGDGRFDLVTMWHFLEHDYDPQASLRKAKEVLKDDGRLIIEVPRLDSVSFKLYGDRWPGLQAPQHTILFDRKSLVRMVEDAGFDVVEWLPWGAFPAYFYLFTGAAFSVLKGKGLDLDRLIAPYFLGQLATTPIRLLEKKLNLAMQTVVCKRR
ncbi:MAG: class I SAM-dependent methyltransferase [Deltaproteobacteria bacterium]|nr:class I SAM-dependent methyltransferase [Deltaproteobacteria bacterium]